MTINELAEYCEAIEIDCDICKNKKSCEKLERKVEDLSPCGLVNLVNMNIELD